MADFNQTIPSEIVNAYARSMGLSRRKAAARLIVAVSVDGIHAETQRLLNAPGESAPARRGIVGALQGLWRGRQR